MKINQKSVMKQTKKWFWTIRKLTELWLKIFHQINEKLTENQPKICHETDQKTIKNQPQISDETKQKKSNKKNPKSKQQKKNSTAHKIDLLINFSWFFLCVSMGGIRSIGFPFLLDG